MGNPGSERAAAPRRFWLERTPDQGQPSLVPGDLEHACRVLRLEVGARISGLDGRGRAWPLEVVSAGRRAMELRALGEPELEPAPGTEGASLPWIELQVPLPKGGRAEDMLDSLTQLGLARLVPLVTARSAPHGKALSPGRRERLERAAREALKQCGRLWQPELGPVSTLANLCAEPGVALIYLERSAERRLVDVARGFGKSECGTRERPLVLIAGPEGGLAAEERESLVRAGATPASLGPHVLRIETAAVAAVAVVANLAP